MKKNYKAKLLGAIAALGLAVASTVGSTYAWFSMNTKVNVTGMHVKTSVSSNLAIASDTVAGTAKIADANFSNVLNTTPAVALLEPVSTVDGMKYFYTLNGNVKPNGDAINDAYVAYNHADTSDFEANSTTGAKGYAEYAFQLKAVNAEAASQFINLKELNLGYRGTDSENGIDAFRVAIFVEKFNEDAAGNAHTANAFHALGEKYDNDYDIGTPDVAYGTTTLMKNANAANISANQAVSSTSGLNSVSYSAFNYIEVDPGETAYYKVVVRLWIEGEDTKCNNTTFVSLTEEWELDLQWELVADANKANLANITNVAYTILKTTEVAGSTTNVNNTSLYAVTNLTFDGKQVYTDSTSLASGTPKLYIANGEISDTTVAPTEVTNKFRLQ